MSKYLYWALALTAITLLAACNAVPGKSELRVYGAWMRPVSAGMSVGGAYFTVENSGTADDRLTHITTEIAAVAEIHETQVVNNVASMVAHDEGLLIPAGQNVSLRPGSLHLMLMNLNQAVNLGDTGMLTLHFESGQILLVEVIVAEQAPE